MPSNIFDIVADPRARPCAILMLIVYGMTLVLNGYAFIVCISKRRLRRTTSVQLALFPMGSEIVKSAISCICLVTFLANGASLRPLGVVGCQAYAVTLICGFTMTEIALVFIAVDRYLYITARKPSTKLLVATNVGGLAISLFLGIGYQLFGSGCEVSAAQSYCMVRWHSHAPGDLAMSIAASSQIAASVLLIGWLQHKVQASHAKPQDTMRRALQTAMRSAAGRHMSDPDQKRVLLIRFYAITLVAVGWFPYLGKVLAEIVSGHKASFEVDTAAVIVLSLSGPPLIAFHILFTPHLRWEVRDHYHLLRKWLGLPNIVEIVYDGDSNTPTLYRNTINVPSKAGSPQSMSSPPRGSKNEGSDAADL